MGPRRPDMPVLQDGPARTSHPCLEDACHVLKGTPTLLIEGQETARGRRIDTRGATAARQPLNRGPERLLLLTPGGEAEHRGRDAGAFATWADEVGGSPQELPLPAGLDPETLRS